MPHYYTKKHYKIWFSEDPDKFLDIENQLRFIRTIEKNIGVTFTFIYSSQCLNETAIEKLNSFCAKFNIISLDFDHELPKLLEHENDKILYELARKEITYTLQKKGGNFACASDIVRLIVPVIAQCGIYGDFEIILNFSKCPDIIERPVPFILRSSERALNNDRLLVPIEKDDPSKLFNVAIESLRYAQEYLINSYNDPKSAILIGWNKYLPSIMKRKCEFSYSITTEYFKSNPHSTFFDWKKFILEADFLKIINLLPDNFYYFYIGATKQARLTLDELKENFGKNALNSNPVAFSKYKAANPIDLANKIIQLITHQLLVCSVMSVSGPEVFWALFAKRNHYFTKQTYDQFSIFNGSCSYKKNLENLYIDKEYVEKDNPFENVGAHPSFDLSWTREGLAMKNSRIESLNSTVTTIQRFWRHAKNLKIDGKLKVNLDPSADLICYKKAFNKRVENTLNAHSKKLNEKINPEELAYIHQLYEALNQKEKLTFNAIHPIMIEIKKKMGSYFSSLFEENMQFIYKEILEAMNLYKKEKVAYLEKNTQAENLFVEQCNLKKSF